MAFSEYSHILWGTKQPTLVFTDNKSVTRFFQTKTIPPALWNACDYVLQFNFEIVHVSGKINTAADFLSRLEINPHEKLRLTLRDDIKTTAIQVNIESADVADEEQIFFLPEETIETEEEIWERKKQSKETIQNEQTTKFKVTAIETTRININMTTFDIDNIKDEARIRKEQDADIILKNIKNKILNQEYDQHLLKTDPRAKQYEQHADRIILKNGLLVRKYYNETGQTNHYQVLLPTAWVPILLEHLHGKTGKHPGISKMIKQCREKYYYPTLAWRIRQWVGECTNCIQNKRINTKQIRPPMINTSELAMSPEDALEIDILPNLPPSAGYTNIITAIDVFSRYLFAYPTQKCDAETVAKCIVDIMTRHAYLPTVIITDKGTQFRAQTTSEITKTLGITLRHATTKHAQTIGILERAHASLKTDIKIQLGERKTFWHKYVQIAVMNYNTTYHSAIGCEPTKVFHGRTPYNSARPQMGLKPTNTKKPETNIASAVDQQINEIYDKTRKY